MFYLFLAITCSVCLSVLMRLTEKRLTSEMTMFLANYLICLGLSILFMNHDNWIMDFPAIWSGTLTGALYLISFLFFRSNIKHNGLVLSSTFMKLGVLIPTLMAIFVFKEHPKMTQILGVVVSVLAIILINYEKTSQSGNKKSWLILLLIFNGLADAMANVFDKIQHISSNDSYLIMTFLSASIITFIVLILRKEKMNIKDALFGMIIGIPNYLSARFLLLALQNIQAVIVYPVYSVAGIILITLIGILIFKEKINMKKLCSLCMIIVALVLLNL